MPNTNLPNQICICILIELSVVISSNIYSEISTCSAADGRRDGQHDSRDGSKVWNTVAGPLLESAR